MPPNIALHTDALTRAGELNRWADLKRTSGSSITFFRTTIFVWRSRDVRF